MMAVRCDREAQGQGPDKDPTKKAAKMIHKLGPVNVAHLWS